MRRTVKIGRNDPCPCWSGKKYKNCCLGTVDWEKVAGAPPRVASRHLTLRGKNIAFITSIATVLQFDRFTPPDFRDIKRAFTPKVVQEIFSAVQDLWPDVDDFESCIRAESGTITALYTGNYEPEAVFRAVTRLALYCDKIYLVDPFVRPENVRDEYNPLLHPEEHRATAIKFAFLWMSLFPWIEAGIVNFVRPLHDFVPGLWHKVLEVQRHRADSNPELKAIADEEVKARIRQQGPLDRGMGEVFFLSIPDETLREMYRTIPVNSACRETTPEKTENSPSDGLLPRLARRFTGLRRPSDGFSSLLHVAIGATALQSLARCAKFAPKIAA